MTKPPKRNTSRKSISERLPIRLDSNDLHFEEILQQAPAMIAITTGTTFIMELANPLYLKAIGKKKDIIGKPLLYILPELKGQPILKILQGVLKKGKPFFGNEVSVMLDISNTGDPQERYFNFVYQPLRNRKGKVYGIMTHAVDVTDHVHARKQLEDSEGRFRAMADNIPNLAWMADPDGSIFWYNSRWFEYTGKNLKQMQGWGWKSVHDPKILPSVLEKWNDSIKKKKSFEMTFPLKGIDGTYRSFLTRIVPIKDKKGAVVRWFGTNTDISEQKKIENDLTESQLQLKAIWNGVLVAMALSDENGNVLDANNAYFELYGFSHDEVVGKNFSIIFPITVRDFAKKKYAEAFFGTDESSLIETKVISRDGTEHIVESQYSFIYDGEKRVAMLSVIKDVTDRRRLEIQKDEFLAVASHELKTPVTSIKAYGQVLQKIFMQQGDEKSTELLQKMDTQINKLTNLISDLLDVTKIHSGNLMFQPENFDFNSLIEEMVNDLQLTTEQHDLVLKLSNTATVFADKERLGQVLTNLISNAIKYSPHAAKIIIRSKKDADTITVTIQDFGIGISKEKQPHVFDRFYRASGPKESTFPGLGLGLYISSEIIKRMRGSISVQSIEGKGSTFSFTLPLKSRMPRGKNSLAKEEIKHE